MTRQEKTNKVARFYLDRLIGYIERGEEDSPHG